jgi:predicted Zn-dependent protease
MVYNASGGPNGTATTRVDGRHVRPMRSVHTVRPGETLESIASQYGTSSFVLRKLNSHQLGANNQPSSDMRLEI